MKNIKSEFKYHYVIANYIMSNRDHRRFLHIVRENNYQHKNVSLELE